MAFNLAHLSVRLTANARDFQSTMRRAENRMVGFGMAAKRVGFNLLALSVTGFAALAARSIQVQANLVDMSRQLSTTVEDLQALRYVSRQAGIRFETFQMGLQRVTRRAGEASEEGSNLRKAFAELNIDTEAFLRLSMADRVALLAGKFKEARDNGRELAGIFKILDTEGVSFNRLAELGTEGVLRQIEAARELGLVNRRLAEQSKEASDALTKFGAGFEGTIGGALVKGWEWLDVLYGIPKALAAGAKELIHMVAGGREWAATTARMKESAKEQKLQSEAIRINAEATLDAAKKEAILRKTSRGMGRQINLATTFINRANRGGQEVRSKKLDSIDATLKKIWGGMRNNATGAAVQFGG